MALWRLSPSARCLQDLPRCLTSFSQAARPGMFRTSNKCHVFVNVADFSNQNPRSSSSGQVAAGHMGLLTSGDDNLNVRNTKHACDGVVSMRPGRVPMPDWVIRAAGGAKMSDGSEPET